MEDKTRHLKLGAWGEREAARYLMGKGYRMLDRNVRRVWGELDLVARGPDGTLVLVEVKTLRNPTPGYFQPEDQMNAGKIERFRRAAVVLAASGKYKEVDPSRGWRLDVIAIAAPYDWEPPDRRGSLGRLIGFFLDPRPLEIRHYPNAVPR